MRIRLVSACGALLMAVGAIQASAQSPMRRAFYQGRNRGPEVSDTLSRKINVGRDGRVSVSNVAGDITITAASGDEVTMEATKRTRGDRRALDDVRILVDERPGRVEIRADYNRIFRNNDVSVDFTVSVPAGVALEVYSVAGRIRVTGVKGAMRLGTVSGNVTSVETPRVEYVRTVSGEIEIGGISHDNALTISSVSGNVQVAGLKARSVELSTVSGEVRLRDAAVERLSARTVAAGVEYAGTLARNGRYEVNSHSGNVRFTLGDTPGFALDAGTFSGSIRSDFQMMVGGSRNPEIRPGRSRRRGPGDALAATYGDGSASLNLRTFSGNITIAKK